jgi:hypothetical protein
MFGCQQKGIEFMEFMSKQQLKELLKENLTVELYETCQGGAKYINIEIRFDEDVICKSEIDNGSYDDRML